MPSLKRESGDHEEESSDAKGSVSYIHFQMEDSGERLVNTESPPKDVNHKWTKRGNFKDMISNIGIGNKSKLFQKLGQSDSELITDYSCALCQGSLIHGRMYLSKDHLLFYANIFGWERLVTLEWMNIDTIKRCRTSLITPKMIKIDTGTEEFSFTSFASCDSAYIKINSIWQNSLFGLPLSARDLRSNESSETPMSRESTEISMVTESTSCGRTNSSQGLVECSPVESVAECSKSNLRSYKSADKIFGKSKSQVVPSNAYIPTCFSFAEETKSIWERESINVSLNRFDYTRVKTYVNQTFRFDSKFLCNALFKKDSKLMRDIFQDLGMKDIHQGPYRKMPDGSTHSFFAYSTSFPDSFETVCRQKMHPGREPNSFYIRSENHTKDIQYGTKYYVVTNHCIKETAPNVSHLKINAKIVYKKKVSHFAEQVVSLSVDSSMRDYTDVLVQRLNQNEAKGNILSSRTSLENAFSFLPMELIWSFCILILILFTSLNMYLLNRLEQKMCQPDRTLQKFLTRLKEFMEYNGTFSSLQSPSERNKL